MEGEKQRLYTSWYNSKGLQCKVVGPSTKCFCDHLFKYHTTTNNKVKCSQAGCKCNQFYYLPIYGSQDFKCHCKHSYQNHDPNKRNCKSCVCKSFTSNWACSCGQKFSQHKTVSETKKQKQAKGQTIHSTQGGIISYSSMLDGADRYQSGIKDQIAKKGIKVKIESFTVSQGGQNVVGSVSAWQLYNTKLKI